MGGGLLAKGPCCPNCGLNAHRQPNTRTPPFDWRLVRPSPLYWSPDRPRALQFGVLPYLQHSSQPKDAIGELLMAMVVIVGPSVPAMVDMGRV